MKRVLILTDGKAGHENQSKAFARALGCDFDIGEVHFKSPFAKAASYFLDRCLNLLLPGLLTGLDEIVRPAADGARYSAVIGTGSGTFYAAKVAGAKLRVPCAAVLYPRGYRLSTFNCIMAPAFDRPASADNVIEIPANIVSNDEAFYEAGVKSFLERHTPGDKPALAVIVGGPNKCSTMTAQWMKEQLDAVFAQSEGYERWVTTSRRTPPDVEKVIESYDWDYRLVYSKDKYNPIPAFVKLARRLYVTAESTGMLSETCTCGSAEVYALDNLKRGGHKFRRFLDDLTAGGYVGGNRKIDLSAQLVRARELLGL